MNNFIKNNKNGIIGTLLFHLLLLLIILFFGFAAPEPKFPDPEGILINFGTDDNGTGKIEPENNVKKITKNIVEETNIKEINLTQDYQDAPVVKQEHKKTNNKKIVENKKEEEKEPEINKTAIFPGNNKNTSTSEGDNNGSGNQGRIDGSKTSTSHVGNGLGIHGIGYSLKGRLPVGKLPQPVYPSNNEYGDVVIEIKVDKNGKVISAYKKEKGTTTHDPQLINAAIKAAWKAKFNRDLNSIQQVGTITYHFEIKK